AFVFDLPVWHEDRSEPMAVAEKAEVRSSRILMVEDNDIVIQMTQALMVDKHILDVVADGAIALHRFEPNVYDVALIDLGLPGKMPGNQVAEKMKALDPHIVTILISGWELTDQDARLAPFDFYIQKPVGAPEHLLNVIAQAVDLHDERVEKS
ncbi:MAG: response regulator, partial [Candidatus Latescibacteria bacterium]|nr:response regulator [Candidatus Latescibacterota bacterium]